MEAWTWVVMGILILVIIILLMKIYIMRKSAREIKKAFADRVVSDTNVLIDISSRDKYMCELAESLNEQLHLLRSARHRYQAGDMRLKEAVTNVSHDLRTPLTAVCGYLDLLEREELPETAGRYLAVIRSRTEVLKQLTDELFRYSMTTSKLETSSFETVVLNRVLEDSISAYYAILKQAGITPEIDIPRQKIERKLDRNGLSRILENIIGNAVKYSDGDLKIQLSGNGEITFSNSASRLDEIQAGRLFERFYTVETARKSTGVGLSIAKALTEQMNGTIHAKFHEGRLEIVVEFPGE